MPIAGEEFVYEMVLKCLLLPARTASLRGKARNGRADDDQAARAVRDLFATSRSCPKTSGRSSRVGAGANGSAPAVTARAARAVRAARTLRRCGRSKRASRVLVGLQQGHEGDAQGGVGRRGESDR